jgi:hypothetical protein
MDEALFKGKMAGSAATANPAVGSNADVAAGAADVAHPWWHRMDTDLYKLFVGETHTAPLNKMKFLLFQGLGFRVLGFRV